MHGGRGGGVAQGGGHVASDRHVAAPMITMGGKWLFAAIASRSALGREAVVGSARFMVFYILFAFNSCR